MSSINFVRLLVELVTMMMRLFLAIVVDVHWVTLMMNLSNQDTVIARHLEVNLILPAYATLHEKKIVFLKEIFRNHEINCQ